MSPKVMLEVAEFAMNPPPPRVNSSGMLISEGKHPSVIATGNVTAVHNKRVADQIKCTLPIWC